MSKTLLFSAGVLALSLSACNDVGPGKTYGDPTSLKEPGESSGIVAWVEKPGTRTVGEASVSIVLGAYTAGEAQPLLVSLGRIQRDADGNTQTVGMQNALASGTPGDKQRFTITTTLSHGLNQLVARIETPDQSKVRTLNFTLSYEGLAPGITMSAHAAELASEDPCSQGKELARPITNRQQVCVLGSVSTAGAAIIGARLTLADSPDRVVELDAEGTFAVPVTLPSDRVSEIGLTVDDSNSGRSSATITIINDQTPPVVHITTSATETSNPSIDIEGTVEDANGIAEVRFEGEDSSRRVLGKSSPFATNVQLRPGANNLTIAARDQAGNEAKTSISVGRVRLLTLSAPKPDVGTTAIAMDRQDLGELLSEADQKAIDVVAIDITPSVEQTLQRIRFPERYGIDTSMWTPAKRNMRKILTMTPDTADLSGTSMKELLDISAAVGLPPPRMLADLLDIAATDYILDIDTASEVLIDRLIGTHPNISRDANGRPVLLVNMYDVLNDLTTIAARFGPSGAHPGFLSGNSRSEVLEKGFLLTLPVHSNLVQYDAVDLTRAAKDYLFLLEGERVLDFNVLTDEFEVVGLKDEPTIDLQFVLTESISFTRAGNDRTAQPDTQEAGFYRGNGQSFSVVPWLFEHIACEIGYRQQHRAFAASDFHRVLRYDAGSIKDAAVLDWNRGWVTIQTAGNLGTPPPPLYAWDLLSEVAQVRLHDPDPLSKVLEERTKRVEEGKANMEFAIEKLPIGLTADQLIEKLRPKLHEQESKLSEILAGDTGLATSRADLYYVPAAGGDGALLFRNADDAGGGVTYATPGFFGDAQLTNKVGVSGPAFGVSDTAHEKVAASTGAVYFAADQDGKVYQIKVAGHDANGVQLEVRANVGGAP